MIICCGEALIDMLPRQMPDGNDVYLPVAGGAIFNTAIGLGRLGESAGFISGLSTDLFGDFLMEALQTSNVSSEFCVRLPNPSTLAFVKLTDGAAEYSFMDENSANRSLSESMLPDLPAEVIALHFGAISLIPEPCGSAYEALMAQHHKDKVISLDPNIRPGFIIDEKAHRARINRMIRMSDIVKVSDEDLDWIEPKKTAAETMNDWIVDGVSIVVYTKGSQGADIYTASNDLSVPAVVAEVVDTVGAGDTFNSGFLSGLRKEGLLNKDSLASAPVDALERAAGLAAKVAAITVSRAGADAPWANEL